MATSYVHKNVSKHGDTLGVAYITSPSGDHLSDVKQYAVNYRLPLPKTTDAVNVYASYSDVDLGNVYSFGDIFDLGASGKGKSFGVHYQHNVSYSSCEKDIWWFQRRGWRGRGYQPVGRSGQHKRRFC